MITVNHSFGVLLLAAFALLSCQQQEHITFTVKNSLDLDRRQETISIPVDKISDLVRQHGAENLLIREAEEGQVLLSQLVDLDSDGKIDEILVQVDVPAKASKKFWVENSSGGAAKQAETTVSTFSRFVPERIDDFAWENDRVAFRTYGPEAQRITESGAAGGTLTSGMDAWLKRVNYPIIDKWYARHQQEPGAYHVDSGEGYDPYHVGDSRGVGGIGIWQNDTLYVSKNFISHKTIAKGPIRTIFELSYASWQAGDHHNILETKRISLDLGSNLSRFELSLQSSKPLSGVAIGLTLHEGQGVVKANAEQGWFRYWEPMDGSELGVGLVVPAASVINHLERRVEQKDQSHLLVIAEPQQGKLVYHAGFGWQKSGQFATAEAWDQYLADYARKLDSPLEVAF